MGKQLYGARPINEKIRTELDGMLRVSEARKRWLAENITRDLDGMLCPSEDHKRELAESFLVSHILHIEKAIREDISFLEFQRMCSRAWFEMVTHTIQPARALRKRGRPRKWKVENQRIAVHMLRDYGFSYKAAWRIIGSHPNAYSPAATRQITKREQVEYKRLRAKVKPKAMKKLINRLSWVRKQKEQMADRHPRLRHQIAEFDQSPREEGMTAGLVEAI